MSDDYRRNASAPVMTASLARTLAEIEANTDLNKILDAEKKIQDALQDEIGLAEEAAQKQDRWSTYGRLAGGWGSALAAEKFGSPGVKKWSPAIGSIGDILGGAIGTYIAGDYKQKDISELGVDIPTTKWYKNKAKQLMETGKSGLSDIGEKSKRSKKELMEENLLRGAMQFPTYAETLKGDEWLSELFGI